METESWKIQLIGFLAYMFIAWVVSLITALSFLTTFGILSIGLMLAVIFKTWRDTKSNDVKN